MSIFNSKKIVSGIYAIAIYFLLIYFILLYYNIHEQKAKNYVEKNSNRITVTLVNSDKTVFNKRSKITVPTKPIRRAKVTKAKKTPIVPTPPPKKNVKKIPPKVKEEPKKVITPTKEEIRAKEIERQKKVEEAKVARAKARRDKERLKRLEAEKKEEKKRLAQLEKEKERKREDRLKEAQVKRDKEAKKRAREARIKKDKEAKERAKNLFSSINTSPKEQQESQVRHDSSITDRIRDTHQSGRVSNKNRERGVENAYIAKIQRKLQNWPTQSNYKGDQVTINFTIYSSGRFKFRITRGSSNPNFNRGITEYIEQLQRIGFGTHSKSTPYDIDVIFRAR